VPELNNPPFGWGKSKVTEYFEAARSNMIATSKNNIYWFMKLERLDSLYRIAIDNLFNSKNVASSFFLLRSHAAYIAAFQMACAGQISESYSIIRNSIESALYGFHVQTIEQNALAWLNRNDDDASKKKARSLFSYSNVLKTLKGKDSRLAGIIDSLYERTIDFGGHPNAFSILTNMKIEEAQSLVDFKLLYLNAGGLPQDLALKTLGQSGISCLLIFRQIWKERFDIIGLSEKIDQEKPDL
jgi:hypothetical protein